MSGELWRRLSESGKWLRDRIELQLACWYRREGWTEAELQLVQSRQFREYVWSLDRPA
ncbi:MAG: hypothetical protein GW867_13740, partial [Armatimonadetes bacterium]|nr:hypothetical protein [Armatimonadota bacterium]